MPAAAMLHPLHCAQAMSYLYSLYDALVSISVPADKARAVVDAMERDMENRFTLVEQKIDTLQLKMTVRLGSMLVVCFGLAIATMRLWT
jgi:hypothetical protein